MSTSRYFKLGDVFYRAGQEFEVIEHINYDFETYVRVRSKSGEEIFLHEEANDDGLRYVYFNNAFLNRRLSFSVSEKEKGQIVQETYKFLVIDNIKIDDKEYILAVEYGVAQDVLRIGQGVSHVPVHIFTNHMNPSEYMARGTRYRWLLVKYSMKMKTTIYDTVVAAYNKSQNQQ